jgi:hypothetical protein
MHEAGAVMAAIHKVIGKWPPEHTAGHLRLDIVDATRADADAVSFYATAILGDLGLDGVDVSVITHAVSCDACGEAVVPVFGHPLCEACGAPLRSRSGPAIVGHGSAAHDARPPRPGLGGERAD